MCFASFGDIVLVDSEIKERKAITGSSYGGGEEFIDPRDQQSYKIAVINGIWWTLQNMNYSVEGYQYYNNEEENSKKSGKMYNWEQAKKVCPEGWRLPTDKELINLLLPYGKISYAGDSEYYRSIFGPYAPEKTEDTYFKMINDKKLNVPVFDRSTVEDQRTMFWSAIPADKERAYAVYWRTIDQYIGFNSVHFSDYPKNFYGFCRCVKGKN